MKIPRKILVNGDLYQVSFRKDLGPSGSKGRMIFGICDEFDHMILIKTGLTPKQRWATFLHELLHAIEYSFKTEYPHKMINCLDTKLAAVLMDNWID